MNDSPQTQVKTDSSLRKRGTWLKDTVPSGAWSVRRSVLSGFCGALVGTAAVPAFADDMMMGAGVAMFALLAIFFAIPIFLAYTFGTVFIEAYVLNRFFRLTYRPCVRYAFLANLASFLVGLALYLAFPGSGWKTALITHEYGRLGLALVRSFGLTMAVETGVLLALLWGGKPTRIVLQAAACANLLSYVLTAVVLVVLQAARL